MYGARWNGTDVALKVVHQHFVPDSSEEAMEKLMEEAEVFLSHLFFLILLVIPNMKTPSLGPPQMSLELKHPNIIEVYGVCLHPVAIVMERMHSSVTQALSSGACPLSL